MKYLQLSKTSALTLGCSAFLSLFILGCDQGTDAPDAPDAAAGADADADADAVEVEDNEAEAPEPIAQVLRADCEATMERCSAVTCSAEGGTCSEVQEVCETKLATVCELVENDAQADLAPCGEGTRCEFMEAVHACFKASLGCDGSQRPDDDCQLKSLAKLPGCIGQAMKDHGGCDGGSCPGSGGTDCESCDQASGPGDGCLLDGLGDSCPAGGCLLEWVKSIKGGQGGCLLDWLGKAGQGCPGCD